MRTGDIILIFVIFAVSLGMNAGNLFSVENLITAGVLLAIIAVIAVIILVDYGPLWRLRAEEIRFCEEKDQDRFADAIETFRRKNKLVTKNHLGYLAEAFL
ncbi:MAG: hypothetical protein IJI05_00555, partial [Erysipelotrichaceae bacterium]|nr:hypothetical protein [Erysipelotrichaceae bacterium]